MYNKRWCQRYAHHGHTYPFPTPGRPKVLDQGQVRNLLRHFVRSPCEPWSVHAKRYSVSTTTIVKIAHEHGFYRRIMRRKPYLSPKTVAKRKEWARNNMKRDWRDVVFTDECALELGGQVRGGQGLPGVQAKCTLHNTSYQPSILVDRA